MYGPLKSNWLTSTIEVTGAAAAPNCPIIELLADALAISLPNRFLCPPRHWGLHNVQFWILGQASDIQMWPFKCGCNWS